MSDHRIQQNSLYTETLQSFSVNKDLKFRMEIVKRFDIHDEIDSSLKSGYA